MSNKMKAKKSAEKTRLVPSLRFPEFRGAEGWSGRLLHEFLEESRIRGSRGDTAKKITVKLWGKGVFGKEEALKGSSNTQYYRRKSGQFIYSKLDFLNQAFGIIPDHLDGFESTVDLPCFDVGDGLVNTFLLEYVNRESFYKKFGEIADGGRKAKRIQSATFLSFPVILPPMINEQKKIADCLSSIDELVTLETQKLDALKAHKKGLMQQLFPVEGETVPRLRFPEFLDAGGWISATLGEVADITSGGTPSRSNSAFWNGDIPWVTTSSIDFNFINRANEYISAAGLNGSSAKIFQTGTLIMAMYGQGVTRGKVAILSIEAATNQACAAILLNEDLISGFVFQNLASRYDEIRELSNDGGQKNLSLGLIREIKIHFPEDKEEQRKIVGCLSSIDDIVIAQTNFINLLNTHKKGLMQQLFPSVDEVQG